MKGEPAKDAGGTVPLRDCPGIPREYTEVLKSRGIRHSGELLEALRDRYALDQLSLATGVPASRLKELHALCDLARVRGTTPAVVRELYRAGIRSVGELARENPASLQQKVRPTGSGQGWAEGPEGGLPAQWIRNAGELAEAAPGEGSGHG